MIAAGLTFEELLWHDEEETERWHAWFAARPETLDLPTDLAQAKDVRGVLLHIAVVEFLYTERMVGKTRDKVSLTDFPHSSVDDIFRNATNARKILHEYVAEWPDSKWNETASFPTLTYGLVSASRRKMFVHAMVHSMRHWAQLATELRRKGYTQDWRHDFLFTEAIA